MKKITLLLFALFAFSFNNEVNAQCTSFSGGGPYTDFNGTFGGAPCDDGTGCPFNEISTFEAWADESYLMDNVIIGHTYTFSLCNGPGAGTWDPSFTIIAPSGAVDAFGTDDGSTCALTWTATEEGTYTIGISEAGIPCDTSTNQATNNGFPAITCTDGNTCPACTVTAPNTVTTPTPADGATNTPVYEGTTGTGAISNGVDFSWEESIFGDAADSFNISIGLTPTGDDIGTLTDFTSGGGVLFGATFNTTYYWKIDAINCDGSTSSPVWSFTTASSLGVEDNTLNNTFSVFPNPTSSILNIESSQDVDNVTVFNLLGQNVANFSKNEITNSSIDLSELSRGLYLVKISSGDKTQTLRVTKE